MLIKCITLNSILYQDKHYRIDRIIFVESEDVRKLVGQGAIRQLVKPKVKRVVHPKIKKKEIKFGTKKIKKFTHEAKKEKEVKAEEVKGYIYKPKKKKKRKEKQYAYTKAES